MESGGGLDLPGNMQNLQRRYRLATVGLGNSCHLGSGSTSNSTHRPKLKTSLYGFMDALLTQSASEERTKRSKALTRHRKHVQIFQLILFLIFILFRCHSGAQNNNKKKLFIILYSMEMSPKSPLMPKTQTGEKGVLSGTWGSKKTWRPGISRKGQAANRAVIFFPQQPFLLLLLSGPSLFGSFSFNGLIPAAVYHNFVDLLSANSNNNNHNSNKNNGHGGKIKIK